MRDSDINTLLIALVAIGYIVIKIIFMVLIPVEADQIARSKGYNTSKFFWYVLIFGTAGLLLVIALPDQNIGYRISAAQNKSFKQPKKEKTDTSTEIDPATQNTPHIDEASEEQSDKFWTDNGAVL